MNIRTTTLAVLALLLVLQFCFSRTTTTRSISSTLENTCFGVSSENETVCNGRGSCTAEDTCECSQGFSGDSCGVQCTNFPSSSYGARKPTVTATYANQGITISVVFDNSDYNSTTVVFHSIDTEPSNSNECRNSTNSLVTSVGSTWSAEVGSCSTKYTLLQTLSQVYSSAAGNKWSVSVPPAGNQIASKLNLYATYSVNREEGCYTVSFPYTVEFTTQLQVAAESDTFSTIDREAAFKLLRIYVSETEGFIVQGKLSSASFQLRDIQFSRVDPSTSFTVQNSACNTGNCDMLFSSALPALGRDASGLYRIAFDAMEGGQVTRPGLNIDIQISYTIPDTVVIDGETITTSVGLYDSNAYTAKKTTSFKSSTDTFFVQTVIGDSSPEIPPGFNLELVEGYVCCVPITSSISLYNPTTNTGGCKDPAGKTEHAQLTGPGVTIIPATPENPKRYRIESTLANLFSTTDHPEALTCEVLVISKLSSGRRTVPKNMNENYSSKVDFNFQSALIANSANSSSRSLVSLVVLMVVALMYAL